MLILRASSPQKNVCLRTCEMCFLSWPFRENCGPTKKHSSQHQLKCKQVWAICTYANTHSWSYPNTPCTKPTALCVWLYVTCGGETEAEQWITSGSPPAFAIIHPAVCTVFYSFKISNLHFRATLIFVHTKTRHIYRNLVYLLHTKNKTVLYYIWMVEFLLQSFVGQQIRPSPETTKSSSASSHKHLSHWSGLFNTSFHSSWFIKTKGFNKDVSHSKLSHTHTHRHHHHHRGLFDSSFTIYRGTVLAGDSRRDGPQPGLWPCWRQWHNSNT